MSTIKKLQEELRKVANPTKAKILSGFFKTYEGGYGEGDHFLGLTVPVLRIFAKKYRMMPFGEVKELLGSSFHEERLIALLLFVYHYQKGDTQKKKEVVDAYMSSSRYVNNWDLVDVSADKILGEYLLERPREKLYNLARSEVVWERRIAIIATYQFIKVKKEYKDTFGIAEVLLLDSHDLIQKAVGWMLREVGKRCGQEVLEEFLIPRYKKMPRTMLRYAIEKFEEKKRKQYLLGEL